MAEGAGVLGAMASMMEESLPREMREASVLVDISDDKMKALVRFDTEKGTKHPPKEKVLAALKASGIVYGIDQQAVERAGDSFASFVVASGKPPKNGKDAYIEKNYSFGVRGRPKVIAYNRVDYKDMNLFVLAKKDQLLLVRVPQTMGVAGRNVLGLEIPAKNGKPTPMPTGKNTEVRNEDELYATIDGQIVEKGKKVEVDPHFVVSGDVGVGTGNIDFSGSVEVKGSVEEGFMVRAAGDIHIGGNINGGTVTGADIYVDGGILGKNGSKVVASGTVRAAFTEHAEIEARREVLVTDVILHSTVKAGERVVCEDKRGQIVGGSVVAGFEVRARTIGNPSEVRTVVTVGVDPVLEEKYHAAIEEQKELRTKLSQIKKSIETMDRIGTKSMSPERVQQYLAVRQAQFPIAGRLKRLALDIEKQKKDIDGMKQGSITARDRFHPNVTVYVCHQKKIIETDILTSTFSVHEGEIETRVYQGL